MILGSYSLNVLRGWRVIHVYIYFTMQYVSYTNKSDEVYWSPILWDRVQFQQNEQLGKVKSLSQRMSVIRMFVFIKEEKYSEIMLVKSCFQT